MAANINNLDMYVYQNAHKHCEITIFNLMALDYYFQFNIYDNSMLSIWEATDDNPINKCKIDLDAYPPLKASPFPGSVNLKKIADRPFPWFVTPRVLIKKNSSKVFSFFVNDFVRDANLPGNFNCYSVSDFNGKAIVTCPPIQKDPRKGGLTNKLLSQGTTPVNIWFKVKTIELTPDGITLTSETNQEYAQIVPSKPFTPADIPYSPF